MEWYARRGEGQGGRCRAGIDDAPCAAKQEGITDDMTMLARFNSAHDDEAVAAKHDDDSD